MNAIFYSKEPPFDVTREAKVLSIAMDAYGCVAAMSKMLREGKDPVRVQLATIQNLSRRLTAIYPSAIETEDAILAVAKDLGLQLDPEFDDTLWEDANAAD